MTSTSLEVTVTRVRRVLGCALLVCLGAGCGAQDRDVVAGPTATTSSPCTDGATGRLVAIYTALLRTQSWTEARMFVSAQPVDPLGRAATSGVPFGRSVAQCLAAGVEGLPKITVVTGRDDPALPRQPATGGLRELPDGPLVMFGPLGPDGTTSISVDKGGGDHSGAEYRVVTAGGVVRVVPTGSQWVS